MREVNALHGIGIDPLVDQVRARLRRPSGTIVPAGQPAGGHLHDLRGKEEIGWQSHFGVVRGLESQTFYRGE